MHILLALFVFMSTTIHSNSLNAGEWSFSERKSLSAESMSRFGVTEDIKNSRGKEINLLNYQARMILVGDCGNLDFRSSFRSLYSETRRLFSDLKDAALGGAHDIGRAAPMLALCYFSPTACSIAKNLQLYSSYTAKLKFDQCQAINSYISDRSNVYKEAQSDCLRKHMAQTNNISEAVEACKNSADRMISWVNGNRVSDWSSNDVVKSSAAWARLSQRDTQLMQALLGGLEYHKQGYTRVSFGGHLPLTPGKLFDIYSKAAFKKLCVNGALKYYQSSGELRARDAQYFTSKAKPLLDIHTLQALSKLPIGTQKAACQQLSQAMSLSKFIDEMNDKFDQLYIMTQNPHLPEEAQARLEKKSKKLLDNTLAVLQIRDLRHNALDKVRSDILSEAGKVQNINYRRASSLAKSTRKIKTSFAECEDFQTCEGL